MSVWNWFLSVTLAQSPQQAGRQASGQMHLRDQIPEQSNSMPGTWLGLWVMEGKKQASLGQIKMLTETHKQILPNK